MQKYYWYRIGTGKTINFIEARNKSDNIWLIEYFTDEKIYRGYTVGLDVRNLFARQCVVTGKSLAKTMNEMEELLEKE